MPIIAAICLAIVFPPLWVVYAGLILAGFILLALGWLACVLWDCLTCGLFSHPASPPPPRKPERYRHIWEDDAPRA